MRATIAGAGIAGLAAAHGLLRIGWDVEIYEQAETLKPLGTGLSLAALLGRLPVEQALRDYDARRVAHARRTGAESRLYARVAQWHNPLVVALRNSVIRTIPERLIDRQLEAVLDISFDPIRVAV